MTTPFIDNTSPFFEVLDYQNQTAAAQANIDALIQYASECIELECNRVFAADDIEEKHDGDNQNYLIVKNPPINSLTSITIFDSEIDGSNFIYKANSGEIRWNTNLTYLSQTNFYYNNFPLGFQNITVNYNGGFETIPTTIKLICAEAVIEYFNREDAAFQIKNEKLGPNSFKSFIDQVIFNKRKMLHKYKLRIAV